VWGFGPQEAAIKAAFASGRVYGSFGGRLSQTGVADALRASDIVVMPSKTTPGSVEQFGRLAVEAHLSGCAVIGYRSGALPEAAGPSAILVDEGDKGALRDAIVRLTTNDDLRRALAGDGRTYALERFAPGTVSRQLVEFWCRAREHRDRR
jgi:glycosyltransferase involved in cell wall biosynthesis